MPDETIDPGFTVTQSSSITTSRDVIISNEKSASTSVTIPLKKTTSEIAPQLSVDVTKVEKSDDRKEESYSPPPMLIDESSGPVEDGSKDSPSTIPQERVPKRKFSERLTLEEPPKPESTKMGPPTLTASSKSSPLPSAPSPKSTDLTPSSTPPGPSSSPKVTEKSEPKNLITSGNTSSTSVKPTVSITTTTLTPPVTTAGKSTATTTVTSINDGNSNKEVAKAKRRSSPKKKAEPKQPNQTKTQFSSPEQMNNANSGQLMFVPVGNTMNMPLMTMGFQGNGMLMPMFVRPTGQGNNIGHQLIQMPAGMFAMAPQHQQQVQSQSMGGQQGQLGPQSQQPRLIAPATAKEATSPTKNTAPRPIEPKIRHSEPQNSQPNQQTLVPVQIPGGNVYFQMGGPGMPGQPRALVRLQTPQQQGKNAPHNLQPMKPIQPKLAASTEKDGKRMPASTQPHIQPRPVMIQTSGGQPTPGQLNQKNAMANFLSQPNFIPSNMRMPGISVAQMNAMANSMPRMIFTQTPISSSNGTVKGSGNPMFVPGQGIPNLMPINTIFPQTNHQVMAQMGIPTTVPTSGTPTTSGTAIPTTTSSKSGPKKRKSEAIGPNDPNMSVKEFITMSKDSSKMKLETQKEEVGPPPLLDASDDGALAPPILKPVGEDEENEPPPALLRDEHEDDAINNIFIREAKLMKQKKTENGESFPIKHYIDGFLIEEDVVPFPIEQQAVLAAFEAKILPSPKPKDEKIPPKKAGRKSKNLLPEKEKLQVKKEVDALKKEEKKPVKFKPELKDILKKIETKSPSPPKSMKGRPPMSRIHSDEQEKKDVKKRGSKTKRPIETEKSFEEPSKRLKPSPTVVQEKKVEEKRPSLNEKPPLPSSSKLETPPDESGKKMTKKRKREIDGLLNMDFGPEKSPFPTQSVEEYKQKVLEEALSLRPKSEEKERSGRLSHESSTTSLQNEYAQKRDSGDSTAAQESGSINTSFEMGQIEQRCLFCNKVLPERKPNEVIPYPQYCDKKCRKYWRKKQKNLNQTLEQSLASSSPIMDMESYFDSRKRSSTGSNSNYPFEKRWSSTGSLPYYGDPLQQQQPSSSTPPNLQRSPLPSPLVQNKSPTSMIIKVPKNDFEPSTSQQFFQNPGMLPPQGRLSLGGQTMPQQIQQARTSTPAQDDEDRALEYARFMQKDVPHWTPIDVARWVNWVVRSDAIGNIFEQEEIDGNALLMLKSEHFENFKKEHNLKMGPSIKLQGALKELKSLYLIE